MSIYRTALHAVLMLLCGYAYAGEPPAAEALKLEAPPVLDGRLDEACWESARPLADFHVFKDEAGRRADDTEVRLAYDDAWLYLGIRCGSPLQQHVLDPRTREHDGPVSADESVELFFSSDGEGAVYYHFMLSCFNVKAEQRIINGSRERQTWNLPWRSAVAVTEEGWTAEAALPLYLFMEYGDLAHIRMNIARNRRKPYMDASNVITHEEMEQSLWRPVTRSFHETGSFGALAPLTPGKLRMPFLASLERVDIRPYYTEGGTNYYRVELELKGGNAVTGAVEAAVIDRPVSGAETVVRERADLQGTRPVKLTVSVPVSAPAERSITVEARDAASGEVWQRVIVEKPAVLKVMQGWLDRNYYTTEGQAVAMAEIGMPDTALRDLTVAVEVDGKTLATAPAAPETAVAFDLGGLAVGRYPVRIALRRNDGAPFAAVKTELIKRAPKPGREVKIDQVNRVVLKDGRPFFPMGIIMAGVRPDDEAAFKDIADAGCNAFFQWRKDLPAADMVKYLERARQHGLQVVSLLETGWRPPKESGMTLPEKVLNAPELEELDKVSRGGSLGMRGFLMREAASRHPAPVKTDLFREYVNRNLPLTEQAVASVEDAENLLAYSTFDEPFDSRRFDMTQSLDAIYRLTYRTDGYHPVKVLYSSHIPAGSEYVTCGDILCTDPYWIPAGPAGRDTPNFVSKIVHWNDRRAAEYRRVVWIVPVGTRWSGLRKRGLTEPEQNCQNFLAIIHGAKGLFWFSYSGMNPQVRKSLKASLDKIKVIAPLAAQPLPPQEIKYLQAAAPEAQWREAAFMPEREEFPDVQVRLVCDPEDGAPVLLAANSRYYPVHATFSMAGMAGREVQRLFDDVALPVRNGGFAEELEPFAVRAYRMQGPLPALAQLMVSSLRPAVIPPRETAWSNCARTGRKNVFPNPSFEEDTIPGLPDYYFAANHFGPSEQDMALVADAGIARFGAKCVQMTKPPHAAYASIQWHCGPQHDQITPYVWSFWAKGGRGGERVWLRMGSAAAQTFELTSDWRRYEMPVAIASRTAPLLFELRLWPSNQAEDETAQIWVDGMQLEKGYAATEFAE